MKTVTPHWRCAVGVLLGAVCALASCAMIRAPESDDGIQTLDDPDVIERCRYLVFGPAHCSACHGNPGRMEMSLGDEIPMIRREELRSGAARSHRYTEHHQRSGRRHRRHER